MSESKPTKKITIERKVGDVEIGIEHHPISRDVTITAESTNYDPRPWQIARIKRDGTLFRPTSINHPALPTDEDGRLQLTDTDPLKQRIAKLEQQLAELRGKYETLLHAYKHKENKTVEPPRHETCPTTNALATESGHEFALKRKHNGQVLLCHVKDGKILSAGHLLLIKSDASGIERCSGATDAPTPMERDSRAMVKVD